MRALRDKLRQKLGRQSQLPLQIDVPLNQCVHYCAFRYGHHEYNPYESYVLDVHGGVPLHHSRRRFIEFLLYYRPVDMAAALGLTGLSKKYPLWIYPWNHFSPEVFSEKRGWLAAPNDCPDILTHFCEDGILSFRIDEEFVWLERALLSIDNHGYQPKNYTSFVSPLQLRTADGRRAYLLLDGNHRVSAMSALGHEAVRVEQKPEDIVFEENCDRWFGVQSGFFTREDALRIFRAYFDGNHNYRTTTAPAPIVGPESWKALYLS